MNILSIKKIWSPRWWLRRIWCLTNHPSSLEAFNLQGSTSEKINPPKYFLESITPRLFVLIHYEKLYEECITPQEILTCPRAIVGPSEYVFLEMTFCEPFFHHLGVSGREKSPVPTGARRASGLVIFRKALLVLLIFSFVMGSMYGIFASIYQSPKKILESISR